MLKRAWLLCKESVLSFIDDDALTRGAAIAYYAIFSMAPILVIAVAMAGWVFGAETARATVSYQAQQLLGEQVAGTVDALLTAAGNMGSGRLPAIISLVTIFVTASAMFGAVEAALNAILGAPPPDSALWSTIRTRLLGIGLVLSVGVLLVVLMLANTVLTGIIPYLGMLPNTQTLVDLGNTAISFVMLLLGAALLYRVLPNRWLNWREVAVGALATASLLMLGRYGIALYMTRAGVASSYGAAGAVFVILLWIYYSALMFLLGAEVTKIYARHSGHGRVVQKAPSAEQSADRAAAAAG